MFIAALFTRANPWKQPRCPSTDEKMRKLWLLFSVAQSFLTIFDSIDCIMPGLPSFTISWSLLKLMSIESVVMPTNYLILCHPPLLLPSIFPSIRVFTNGSALHIRWPQYWSSETETLVLLMNIQDWFSLGLTALILQSKGLSRVFSKTTVQKHQFFGTHSSLWSSSHIHTCLLEKP